MINVNLVPLQEKMLTRYNSYKERNESKDISKIIINTLNIEKSKKSESIIYSIGLSILLMTIPVKVCFGVQSPAPQPSCTSFIPKSRLVRVSSFASPRPNYCVLFWSQHTHPMCCLSFQLPFTKNTVFPWQTLRMPAFTQDIAFI